MSIVLRQEIEIDTESRSAVTNPLRTAIGSFWGTMMERTPEKHSVYEWTEAEFEDFVQLMADVAMAQTLRQQIKVITVEPAPYHA